MFGWLKKLFSNKQAVVPGERWQLNLAEQDPWGKKNAFLVTVLDVKNGWVMYDIGYRPFREEVMEIRRFVCIYSKVEDGV